MDLEIALYKLIDVILFPPGINLILIVLGYFLRKKARKIALVLATISVTSLYFFSLPIVSNSLNEGLQTAYALTPAQVRQLTKQQREDLAIVILSGGRLSVAPEYGDIDTVSSNTLQRIQYGAWLHRKTNLPILVSGGSVLGEATAEAVLMNQTMLAAYNIAPKWIEFESRNTAENAQFSQKILRENGITEILLVTHATHMHRAKLAFENVGVKVIAAPTVFESQQTSWLSYLPTAKALYKSQLALHEKMGRFWYSLRYE